MAFRIHFVPVVLATLVLGCVSPLLAQQKGQWVPEGIAPISGIRGSEVRGGPLGLTAKTKMLAEVVFRVATKSKGKTCDAADATPIGRQVTGS